MRLVQGPRARARMWIGSREKRRRNWRDGEREKRRRGCSNLEHFDAALAACVADPGDRLAVHVAVAEPAEPRDVDLVPRCSGCTRARVQVAGSVTDDSDGATRRRDATRPRSRGVRRLTWPAARHLRARRVARHMPRRRAQQLGDGRARRRRRRSTAAVRLHGRRRRVAGALLRPAPGPRRKWRRPFRLGAVDRSAQHLDVDLTRQLAALHRAERTCEGRRGRWTHTDHHDRRSLATRCDPSFFLSLSPSPHAPRIAPRGR